MLLFSFCDFPWWLAWLLPALLGLAAGWALWSKYKGMFDDLQGQVSGLNAKIKSLEAELAGCRSHSATLEGDIALAKGKLREAEESGLSAQKSGAVSNARVAAPPPPASDMGVSSLSATSSPASGSGAVDKYAKLTSDNLQVIEGIGPKMDEVLKANGIGDWSALAASTPESLRTILNKYGDQYKIIDPATWPQQAKLASDRNFMELMSLQKNLDTGVDSNTGETPAKIEKIMIKLGILKAYKQDDLKVVEGIGPKIEELMHNAGIKTWAALAAADVSKLKGILDAAGPKFQLADPGTWSKQAELLDAGKFQELEAYQETLKGGK
jgi:predicted flap endonuclease-1-like 5' DNA nuclease